jgi:hypothetical protein
LMGSAFFGVGRRFSTVRAAFMCAPSTLYFAPVRKAAPYRIFRVITMTKSACVLRCSSPQHPRRFVVKWIHGRAISLAFGCRNSLQSPRRDDD